MLTIRVLLLGQSGQLATELKQTVPGTIELKVLSYYEFCTLADADLNRLFMSYRPDWVINAFAFNKVDQAELSPELALAGNFYLVQKLQQLCAVTQSRLLHISSDYVFDGHSFIPYNETDLPRPLGQYGQSKLLAEQWLQQEYAASSLIIRTSWLYSAYGSNFVKTMLKLMQTKDVLQLVQDQQGSPCWAYGLSCVIWQVINTKVVTSGIYHWADTGYCSRYEFALEIQALGLKLGLLSHNAQITAVDSGQFSQPAVRPAFSALDSTLLRNTLSLPVLSWQAQLERALRSFLAVHVNQKGSQ